MLRPGVVGERRIDRRRLVRRFRQFLQLKVREFPAPGQRIDGCQDKAALQHAADVLPRDRNAGLSFSNLSWQSEKISAKESCLYGIINIRITPFLGVWFLVFRQLYYTISSEGLFVF